MIGRFRTCILALCAMLLLGACATDTRYDSVDQINAARYVHNGPSSITLYTMVNTSNGSGAHTSMMVNASQRVIFDPAGSVSFSGLPENADVLYGITPKYERAYESAHARKTFYVAIQKIDVSPEVAEQALNLVLSNGAVVQTFCAKATSSILRQLPGFESIGSTFYPNNLRDQFAKLPGVTERILVEQDEDDKTLAVQRLEAELAQQIETRVEGRSTTADR
ncbi:MAG: hypothetical protein MK098_11220 [Marinovum sp.]|nr:hypothetical protein [Marinovum sp.]